MTKTTRPTDKYRRNNNIPKSDSIARLTATRQRIASVKPTLGKFWQAKMLAYYDRLIAEAKARSKGPSRLLGKPKNRRKAAQTTK